MASAAKLVVFVAALSRLTNGAELAREAAKGETDLHVDNVEGFKVGDDILIEGGGNSQDAVIAGLGDGDAKTIEITEALDNGFPAGADVTVIAGAEPPETLRAA